ncbi:hypothetical protein [Sinorhizobium meliloti]|uniref:hypothetical protein n=1 Tax=Rhizobium meliloti TaxID=382 RepID=UPI0018E014D1|nr:hypothetical protein [Sinorhizobium meliloti]MDE3857512.1 hypothetical protein [Sinorhizobium meliloti]
MPLDMQNRDLVVGVTTSGAEELARMRPKARWVSAFNTSPSEAFFDVFARKGRESRPQLLYCGDDHEAKATAAGLIEDIAMNRSTQDLCARRVSSNPSQWSRPNWPTCNRAAPS